MFSSINRREILSAAGLTAMLVACNGERQGLANQEPVLATASRIPMKICVREAAELQAATVTRLKCEIESRGYEGTTLIYLISEGSAVKKGDRVAELDVSELIDKRASQEIDLERARASLVEAEQNMKIQLKEIKAAEENARSKLTLAAMDLEKFLGRKMAGGGDEVSIKGTNAEMLDKLSRLVAGTPRSLLLSQVRKKLLPEDSQMMHEMGSMANQVLAQIDEIELASADLKVKEEVLSQSIQLHAKSYLTKNELDRDRLAHESQLSKLALAWNQLDLLINYTLIAGGSKSPGLIDLRLNVSNAKLELDKVNAQNLARKAREEADLKSKQAGFNLEEGRFDKLVEQVGKSIIRAPHAGLVVYGRHGSSYRPETVEEGDRVRERQTIVALPDISSMIAEVKIQESNVRQVAAGQKVKIVVDAFPERSFSGVVERVSILPDSAERYTNEDLKIYKSWVAIEDGDEDMRPGMSATVEINIGDIPDALAVPVGCVQIQGSVPYVWKAAAQGPEAVRVELGPADEDHVQILSGLKEGEKVHVSPPLAVALPVFEQPMEVAPASADQIVKAKRPPAGADGAGRGEGRRDAGMGGSFGSELTKAIAKKYPRFAKDLEGGAMAIFRNSEIRELVQNDPELKALSDKMRAEMRTQFGGRGGGERGGERGGGRSAGTGRGRDGR